MKLEAVKDELMARLGTAIALTLEEMGREQENSFFTLIQALIILGIDEKCHFEIVKNDNPTAVMVSLPVARERNAKHVVIFTGDGGIFKVKFPGGQTERYAFEDFYDNPAFLQSVRERLVRMLGL